MGSRAPGGSSSGAAIAVACGISPLAMGTDTAGSVRIPAAFNGLVGYKSSKARYSQQGVFPLSSTLDSLGPLARNVADCIAFDRILTGRPFEPLAAPALPGSLHVVVDSAAWHGNELSDAVRSNLATSLNRLRDAGATVVERPLPSRREFELALDSHGWLGAFEAFIQHRDVLSSPQAALLDPRVRSRIEAARAMPEATYLRLLELRRMLMRQIQAELEGATLILPTVAHTAPALAPLQEDARHFAEVNLRTLRITMFGSFLDMGAFTVPNGTDAEGLPTGLQLLRPSGHDESLFTAALAIEAIVQ
jgi:aspartyl-tRNA(Asn)/glutamyl-tRNA(Gln) amidotransferase subunit A